MSAYLDHAATTPMRREAVDAWLSATATGGNPSSLHAAGRRARRLVEESREDVAGRLGVGPSEVVWTAGGTEADNLGVKGLYRARVAADPARRRIISSPVEHHAVLDCVEWLSETERAEVRWLDVHADGTVDLASLADALAEDPASVALVTCMWANNEVGSVQPVREVVEAAHRYGVPVHVDAVQALGWLDVDLTEVPADSVAVSGHKLGGPVGAGVLVLRRGVDVVPVLHGGGQERGVRSGTVDTAAVAGLAAALAATCAEQAVTVARVRALRDDLMARMLVVAPDLVVRGADPALPGARLPNNLHVTFPGCEGDSLLYLFDAQGIEVSTGSACRAGVPEPSHVLRAMGVPDEQARGALRFSLGHTSTAADVDAVVRALPLLLQRAREAGARALRPRGPAVVPA